MKERIFLDLPWLFELWLMIKHIGISDKQKKQDYLKIDHIVKKKNTNIFLELVKSLIGGSIDWGPIQTNRDNLW